jgi:hypothetical protein
MKMKLDLEPAQEFRIMDTIRRDTEFLANLGIMDYSMLLVIEKFSALNVAPTLSKMSSINSLGERDH